MSAYCRAAGKYLPTEAQWELAARGGSGNSRIQYPWGNEPVSGAHANFCDEECDSDRATLIDKKHNDGFKKLAPVVSFEKGKSKQGVYNLAGNVREWVRDWYSPDFYNTKEDKFNPVNETEGKRRIVRGGSWASPVYYLRVSHRYLLSSTSRDGETGFRCVAPKPK